MARAGDAPRVELPPQPIDRVLAPLVRFMHIQASGGVVLLLATAFALAAANSPWSEQYLAFWQMPLGVELGPLKLRHPLLMWINDALMAVFFFVTGMEVKREFVLGELRNLRTAAIPLLAALGGMAGPAAIYLALQWGEPGESGWGIPMATDIAFVVGCMMILGDRVPQGLRIMLLTLAIADDIGAILVIALGYNTHLELGWLAAGFALMALIVFMAQVGVRSPLAYTLVGAVFWFAFHESGIHATIAGVLLGLLTPARPHLDTGFFAHLVGRARDYAEGDWEGVEDRAAHVRGLQRATREVVSPLEYLMHVLHPWVAFGIMPLFALANAGVPIRAADLASPVALAVMAGLVLGKPAGVLLTSLFAVKLGLAQLPTGVTWRMLAGGGCLCGIGFTMALFIAGLAVDPSLLDAAKIGVLSGSVLSAVLGMTLLLSRPPRVDASATEP